MTTSPTQGEHAQPEAPYLQLADLLASGQHLVSVERKEAADAIRTLHAQVAAQPAAPQGGAYAELADKLESGAVAVGSDGEWVSIRRHVRDEAVQALRASHGQAPEWAELPESREAQMVVISRDEAGSPTIWCDPEIAPIVTALNAAGMKTVASCSGHGNAPGVISLADGRAVVIARDSIECEIMTRVRGRDVNGVPIPPKGYVWMPVTPTLEMLDALRANTTVRLDQRYANLLAAASHGQAPAGASMEALRHSANEWADMAANGLQWVRNIADGISDPKVALENLEANLKHCREVNDSPEVQAAVRAAATPTAQPAPAAEQVAWESTTPAYTRYVTQARYEKFSPAVRRWYKPYKCSSCEAPAAGAVAMIAMVDAAMVEMKNITPPLRRSECERLIRAALAAAPTPAAQGDAEDAARYRLVRRGQHWSVIDGLGDTLCGDDLDKRVDAALAQKEVPHGS